MFHRRESHCKKILILFPSKKEKTISKQHGAAKEKESILNVLAAGLVKTSSVDVESPSQLQDLHQVTHKYTKQYPFSNSHEEADTGIFWLCSIMKGDISTAALILISSLSP